MSKRDINRRANAEAQRAAERFATARSPIRYAPDETSSKRTTRENDNLRRGLCAHGKYPRLIAEGISRVLGYKVQGCSKCA